MRREQRNSGPLLTRATAIAVSAVVALGGQIAVGPSAYASDTPDTGVPEVPRPEAPQAPEGLDGSQGVPVSDMPEMPEEPEGLPMPGAIDIQDQEPFDANDMFDDLCAGGPNKRVEGGINGVTGEFLPKREYRRQHGDFRPHGDWEILKGQCHFPELGHWDHAGAERQLIGKQRNLGSGADSFELTFIYVTSFDASTSTGHSVSKTVADDIFSTTTTHSHDHSWSWGTAFEVDYLRVLDIPACTEVSLVGIPMRHTVRVQPVFEVQDHRFDRNARRLEPDNWRLQDDGPKRIFSDGFHIDGSADLLLPGNIPDLTLEKREKALPKKLCQ